MDNKEGYILLVFLLTIFAAIVDFTMFMTILMAFIILTIFIVPSIDFSEEYARVMRGGDFGEETGWKVTTIIVMFFTLMTLLHKPMLMLLGK